MACQFWFSVIRRLQHKTISKPLVGSQLPLVRTLRLPIESFATWQRRLNAEEVMLLNCGIKEDSGEFL